MAARGTIVGLAYGAPDQRTMFTPERIAIEKLDGTMVAERYAPRDSVAGHQMNTPWDPLHRAYFNGEVLWTYLTTPFCSQWMGCVSRNRAMAGRVRKLGACCAHTSPARSRRIASSNFFFGEDLMLRRHDYSVNIAGVSPRRN